MPDAKTSRDRMTTGQHQAVGSSKPLFLNQIGTWRGILGLYLAYLLFHAWQARNAPFVYAMLMDDPQIRRIIEAVVTLNTEPGAINVVFQSGALSRQVVPALVQLLWERPDVAFETELQLRHLIAFYERLPANTDRFGLLLQAAFTLAAERSMVQDPLLENRAAIFALAILLGHIDLEPFVGELLDPDLRAQASRMIGTVPLRGRRDWTRHFWVSAALVLLSNEPTSDRIGLLKEKTRFTGWWKWVFVCRHVGQRRGNPLCDRRDARPVQRARYASAAGARL